METNSKLSTLYKKYKNILIYTFFISVSLSLILYVVTKDITSTLIGLSPMLFTILYIFFHERNYSLLISSLTGIILITFISGNTLLSNISKLSLNTAKNRNMVGYNVLILLLLATTILTIYASIMSASFYTTIRQTPGKTGDNGNQGKLGETGDTGIVLTSDAEIIQQQVNNSIQNDFRELLSKQNPEIVYDSNKNYLKNIQFITKVNSLMNTTDGKTILKLKYIKMSEKIKNNSNQTKDCCNEKTIQKEIIQELRVAIKQWMVIFLKYSNGKAYLYEPYYEESKWNVLITEEDKTSELTNPVEELKTNKVWNWGK